MKNKKQLKILAIIIPVLLLAIIVYLFANARNKKEKISALSYIPNFTLQTVDGKALSSRSIGQNANKVFIYFSPHCSYCHSEAEELQKIYKNHPEIEWFWIATEPEQEIINFAKQYRLYNIENVIWCRDSGAIFYQSFSISSIPYILVYNHNNQLIFRNKGVVKLEKIIEKINEGN